MVVLENVIIYEQWGSVYSTITLVGGDTLAVRRLFPCIDWGIYFDTEGVVKILI